MLLREARVLRACWLYLKRMGWAWANRLFWTRMAQEFIDFNQLMREARETPELMDAFRSNIMEIQKIDDCLLMLDLHKEETILTIEQATNFFCTLFEMLVACRIMKWEGVTNTKKPALFDVIADYLFYSMKNSWISNEKYREQIDLRLSCICESLRSDDIQLEHRIDILFHIAEVACYTFRVSDCKLLQVLIVEKLVDAMLECYGPKFKAEYFINRMAMMSMVMDRFRNVDLFFLMRADFRGRLVEIEIALTFMKDTKSLRSAPAA
jgi:hypothetical protein